jgi:ubiquinone/menaquinone biosynthesis C-methylase UbiE
MRISFDRAAEIYDATRGPPKQALEKLIETIVGELGACGSVLDVGVGTGRFAKPLQDRGYRVVGIDIAREMLGKGVEKGVGDLLRADACAIPFRNETFDAAICIHLLHLIEQWKEALQEICRVTQKTMLSITYTTRNPVRQAYKLALERLGYTTRRLGKGEWELADAVELSRQVFAAAFDNSADELLAYLSQRAYSSQWEVPEDVNKRVVDELKQVFSGKTFPAEVRVLVWNIAHLKACMRTPPKRPTVV